MQFFLQSRQSTVILIALAAIFLSSCVLKTGLSGAIARAANCFSSIIVETEPPTIMAISDCFLSALFSASIWYLWTSVGCFSLYHLWTNCTYALNLRFMFFKKHTLLQECKRKGAIVAKRLFWVFPIPVSNRQSLTGHNKCRQWVKSEISCIFPVGSVEVSS